MLIKKWLPAIIGFALGIVLAVMIEFAGCFGSCPSLTAIIRYSQDPVQIILSDLLGLLLIIAIPTLLGVVISLIMSRSVSR